MKVLNLVPALALITLIGCSKFEKAQPGVTGRWTVLTDSITTQGAGFIKGSQWAYPGTSSDYFLFSATGNLQTKEGSLLDTGTYLITARRININYTAIHNPDGSYTHQSTGFFDIASLSPNSLILTQNYISPGVGQVTRTVRLKK